MNAKKWFGAKSITNLLYGIAMLLPMFSILGRVIYVQSNKNARDSYYGQTINESITLETTYNNLKLNTLYNYANNNQELTITENVLLDLNVKIFNAEGNIYNNNPSYNIEDVNKITIIFNTANNFIYYKFLLNDSEQFFYTRSTYSFMIEFELSTNIIKNDYANLNLQNFYYTSYNKYSYLDNSFDYSIYTFTKDNNLGKVDLFGWFTNLFLDSSNSVNNLYVGFVNWYLNYALLISSGYLIFLVLIWFINFVRKIMDKSMYQDYGGF